MGRKYPKKQRTRFGYPFLTQTKERNTMELNGVQTQLVKELLITLAIYGYETIADIAEEVGMNLQQLNDFYEQVYYACGEDETFNEFFEVKKD